MVINSLICGIPFHLTKPNLFASERQMSSKFYSRRLRVANDSNEHKTVRVESIKFINMKNSWE